MNTGDKVRIITSRFGTKDKTGIIHGRPQPAIGTTLYLVLFDEPHVTYLLGFKTKKEVGVYTREELEKID